MVIGTAFRRIPVTDALPTPFCSLFVIKGSFLSLVRLSCIDSRLWYGLRLNISSGEPMAALYQLKLHESSGANRAITLSRNRRKVEKHFVGCTLTGNHAETRGEIEPAYHSLYGWQTVCTQRWSSMSPFLLRDANP